MFYDLVITNLNVNIIQTVDEIYAKDCITHLVN